MKRVFYVLSVSFIIIFIVMNVLQFVIILDIKQRVSTNLANNFPISTEQVPTNSNFSQETRLPSIKEQLDKRQKIDDFLAPELWRGSVIKLNLPGSISISTKDGAEEVYRKFDGFLDLKTYIYLDLEVDNLDNLEWITLYLMEDLSYSNYFECNLLPLLSNGNNLLVINKKDFIIGTGKPEWNSISTVKVAFETKKSDIVSTIQINEISTYEAYAMCSIWFDDGWKTTYTQAYPMMQQKQFKGILSVISSHTTFPGYCNADELGMLYGDGWDFVNHTHSHKNLIELSSDSIEYEIKTCRDFLMSNGFTRAYNNFVPPYCTINETVDRIIRDNAMTSRISWDSYNYLPINDPYRIGFKEVTFDTTPQMVFEWINEAITNDL